MRKSADPNILVQKISDFPKFMIRTDREEGRGQFFAILCGRLLWTASKINNYTLKKCDNVPSRTED